MKEGGSNKDIAVEVVKRNLHTATVASRSRSREKRGVAVAADTFPLSTSVGYTNDSKQTTLALGLFEEEEINVLALRRSVKPNK